MSRFLFVLLILVKSVAQAQMTADLSEADNPAGYHPHTLCRMEAQKTLADSLRHWTNPEKFPSRSVLVVLAGGSSRVCEAVDFYHRHQPLEIIVTGYPHQVESMVTTLLAEGVPGERILREIESQNTRDHAYYINKIIHDRYLIRPPVVLLTDKWHMMRAKDYFTAYGFPPDAAIGSNRKWVANGKKKGGRCFRTKNPVDPKSKINNEAEAYADAGLCYGLWPQYRDDYPMDSIAMDRTLSVKQFDKKCRKFIKQANQKMPRLGLSKKICKQTQLSVVDGFNGFEDVIECLTVAKRKSWSTNKTYKNCHDEIIGKIYGVPKHYVNTLISNDNLLENFKALSTEQKKKFAKILKKHPIKTGPSSVKGFHKNNKTSKARLKKTLTKAQH